MDQEIFTKNQNQEVIEKKVLFESNAQTDLILENIEKGDYQRAKSLIEESKGSFNNIEFEENASWCNDELEDLAEEVAPMKKEVMKSFKVTNYKLKRRKI